MSKKFKSAIGVLVLVLILVIGYFSFFSSDSSKGTKTIKVGIMTGSKQDQIIWNSVAKTAKEKYGLNVEYKKFTDYSQPNRALSQGEINVNAFQHYEFLRQYNKASHTNIVPIGKTMIGQGRIYSKKIKHLNDIKNGGTIVIPNDSTNEARALNILQSAGLIKVKKNVEFPTTKDIINNPKNLKIKEVDASQTVNSLSSVDAANINGNYAQSAGLSPNSAIYVEPLNKLSEKWVNIIAANKEDKDNKLNKEFVKAYQTDKTKRLMKKYYGKSQITAWDVKF